MKKLLLLTVLFLSQLAFSQSDCVTAIPVCGNSGISYTPTGPGETEEILGGCLTDNENFSVWYKFTIETAGTLTFVITPASSADYDWAVYGPNKTCDDLGTPVRCSFSGGTGPTGLNMTSLDTSEAAGTDNLGNTSDRFVKYMDVLPGETYYLIVDNFSNNTSGFSLTWGGTATLSSAFTNPTLAPNPFVAPGVPNPAGGPNEIPMCPLPTTFDFSTLTASIVNGNLNFNVTYHTTANDALFGTAPITTPIVVNGTDIYYYSIKYQDPVDPTNPLNECRQTGRFKFKLAPLPLVNVTLSACNINNTGTGIFDLTSAPIYSGTSTKKYYPTLADLNAGTNEIIPATAYSSTVPKTIYVKVSTTQGCSGNAQITLQFLPPLTVLNVTIKACNNNGAGTGVFDLTSANVYPTSTNVTKKYYLSLADLTAGTNEITNTTNYTSAAPKTIYVKVSTPQGCTGQGQILLDFYPVVSVYDASLESCFIATNTTTALFDLTSANVTAQTDTTKKYYKTNADALAGTNEILNPSPDSYVAATGVVYVKVFNSNGCFAISKISLRVIPPVKSTILKDKTICFEDKTTLDAGAGFDEYEWSNGATTSSITNVGVGAYWVNLRTGSCWTLQPVNVYSSEQPVITNINITNDSFTITVNGGTAPYKYSIDGINWQDSNVFTGLPRGENKIYVKDSFDCAPIDVQVTVPNLLNAITPNGDNKNDFIDYSALAYKKNLVFTIYDRYGNMLYKADKIRDFTWDGTSGGKKVITGTYWYTITWNENDKNNTQTKYDGWVLVKNRE